MKNNIIAYIVLFSLNILLVIHVLNMKSKRKNLLEHYYLIQTKADILDTELQLMQTCFYQNYTFLGKAFSENLQIISSENKELNINQVLEQYYDPIILWYSNNMCQPCVHSLFEILTSLPKELRDNILVLTNTLNKHNNDILNIKYELELNSVVINSIPLLKDLELPCFIKLKNNKIIKFYKYVKELGEYNKIMITAL